MAEIQPYITALSYLAAATGALVTLTVALIKVTKLISIGQRIIEEMAAMRDDVAALQTQSAGYRTAIAWLLGKEGQSLDALDDLVKRAQPPERDAPE